MGVIGVLAIISALYPWMTPGPFGIPLEVGAAWPMFIVGTVYLVASFTPVSWKLLAGMSLLGLLTVVASGFMWGGGYIGSGGLVFDGWVSTMGWNLAVLTMLTSLFVVWRMRSVEESETDPEVARLVDEI